MTGRSWIDRREAIAGAGLVLLVLVAFLPALDAGWVWDDDDYVVNNRNLNSIEGLARIWLDPDASPQYYPLVFSTFWVEHQLWGLAPAGYHAVNVGLHALAALLAWRLLRRLGVPGAWVAAALFAVHPVQVESVAWVTERKNLLSAVFYLAAFLAYLRGGRRAYGLALSLFVGALLAKTVAASLPVVILIVTWWKKGRVRWEDVRPTLPMFAVGAIFGLGTVWLERHHVRAAGAAWELSPVDRVLVACRALWFYVGKLAWPHPLSFIYARWRVDAGAWLWWVAPAVVASCVGALFALRGRIGRGPLAAAAVFAVVLFPALGFFDIYPMRFSFVADHFQYLACLAPIALAAAALGSRRVAAGVAGAVLCVCMLLTWSRCLAFRDEETLWRDTLDKVPSAFIAHNNLGGILFARGEVAAARGHFESALAVAPLYPEALVNLGLVLEREGRRDEAVAQYRKALAAAPETADAHNNLGIALAEEGDLEGAIASFQRAVAHRKEFPNALYNLGVALLRAGRPAEALPPLERALLLDPADEATRRAVATARGQSGTIP